MAEVTMVESRNRRAMPFWAGFGVGVVFMLVAVIVFWFLGLVDIFPAPNTTNTTVNNAVTNEDNDTEDDNDLDEPNDTEDNDTSNVLDNITNETSSETTGSASVKVDGGTLTLAKNVDEAANPVDPTAKFTTDDERIYIVFEITDAKQFGTSPELLIEWFIDDKPLSDFTYELPAGQSRVYFYQNNAGVGDYEVKLSADGSEVGSLPFTVKD